MGRDQRKLFVVKFGNKELIQRFWGEKLLEGKVLTDEEDGIKNELESRIEDRKKNRELEQITVIKKTEPSVLCGIWEVGEWQSAILSTLPRVGKFYKKKNIGRNKRNVD